MTEEDDLVLDIENDPQSEDAPVRYCFRDGVIFLIDATEPMFEIDPDAETSYFAQCLEAYKNILSEKLSWNKTDWMGIILLGTNECDQNPEIKHIVTWLPFQEVSIDQMIKIDKTLKDVEKFRSEIGSSMEYPLYNALLHAARRFNAAKIKMPFRSIVLLTRVDNPCANDPAEQYRIRLKVGDNAGLHIQLSVVGLGKEWNPKHFFAELEVRSGKFDRVEDYRRTFLVDLQEQVKHASRITGKLHWTLGNGVKLGVCLSTIVAKTKFPKKIRLNKENNEPLDAYSFLQEAESVDDEDEDGDEDPEKLRIALPKDVYKYQKFGGRGIKFSMPEVFKLANSCEPGIKLLGFKPLDKLDLSLHLDSPKLVTYNEEELAGSKTLFAALLKKCDARNVMAICAVTLRSRSGSHLYTLIPNMEYGGFYAYKLPFAENVRKFDTILPDYIYNDTDNLCPIDEDIADLCYKFIKKTSIAYEPTMFLNPKLHTELDNIESLALDRESLKNPIDTTIPNKEAVHERLGDLKDRFEKAISIHDIHKGTKRPMESASVPRNKVGKMDEELDFEELVRDRRVDKCTVKQLKDYLKSVGANSAGRKGELVDTVYTLFGEK